MSAISESWNVSAVEVFEPFLPTQKTDLWVTIDGTASLPKEEDYSDILIPRETLGQAFDLLDDSEAR